MGRWFFDDDNCHPHHLSLAGDISFGGFWSWFTKPKQFLGMSKTHFNLTVEDWENFPNIKDAKLFHWPAYTHPGQETLPTVVPLVQSQILSRILPKTYADPIQFENLAKYPEAHEQKFAAALKILLTYQPEMIKKRLLELFGDVALNYTSLDTLGLTENFERAFPNYCNAETNKEPLVDFIMKMYQKHYDNLYRVVVFYMGCASNQYGVALPATYTALYQEPSYYHPIKQWVIEQNKTIYANDADDFKFNEVELEKRYHQIWRDAFAPTIKDLLSLTYKLTNTMLQKMSNNPPEISGKTITDANLTNVCDYIGTYPDISIERITVDPQNKISAGLLLLVEFTNKLNKIYNAYYHKDYTELQIEDNKHFCQQLDSIVTDYNLAIRNNLAFTSEYAETFSAIVNVLYTFKSQMNFKIHLLSTDEQFFSQQLLAKGYGLFRLDENVGASTENGHESILDM